MCRLWDDENFEIRIRKTTKQKTIKNSSKVAERVVQVPANVHDTFHVECETKGRAVSSFITDVFSLSVGHQSHYHSCPIWRSEKRSVTQLCN
jgi:hypothetical protein